MNFLITMEDKPLREVYFPNQALNKLRSLGNVILNEKTEAYTPQELAEAVRDVDVCITHWGCPLFTGQVLKNANRLRLIAHAAGSVADLVTDEVYEEGIKVCSANDTMARYVAEGVLAYILAGIRHITLHDSEMKRGELWLRRVETSGSLFDKKLGLVGLGTVGLQLLDLLEPFHVQVKIYDPYLIKDRIAKYSNVTLCSLDEVLSWGDVISIHASLTQETYQLINKRRLALLKDHTLLVNTARGLIVDETALVSELASRRIGAVLDVFEEEPLDLNSPLRKLENVILMPHMAGSPAREVMTYTIIDEVGRYLKEEPLQHEISFEKFKLMTKEHQLFSK